MTAIGYNGNLPADRWNPPPPSFRQIHQDLIRAIDRKLADVPIRQQTVMVAVLWDVNAWGVEVLTAPPTNGRYDGWAECLIDFDQYHGSIECIRQGTAEALADELMEATFPKWRNIQEFGPAWDAEPPDLN